MKDLTERLRKLVEDEVYVDADDARVAMPKSKEELENRMKELGIEDDNDATIYDPPAAVKHQFQPSAAKEGDTLVRNYPGRVEFYRIAYVDHGEKKLTVQPWASKDTGNGFVPIHSFTDENAIDADKELDLLDNNKEGWVFQGEDEFHAFYWDGKPVQPV